MVGLFEDDCRSLIFLIDTAGCSTVANVSKGKGSAFLRQVAKEHCGMILSVIERLLAHSQQFATGGVLWTFKIFDSQTPTDNTKQVLAPSFSFSHPSLATIDECRKMVLKQFNSSCENIGSPTCSLETASATIIDGIAAVSKQIGTPDSFLVDSTDTDCTPMKKKKRGQNPPLVVLLAKAPHGRAELDTFLNAQQKSINVKKEYHPPYESDEEIVTQLNQNDTFNRAIEDLSKNNAQLLWIDSYSRRVQDISPVSSRFCAVFKSWILRKPGVNAFIDMHSLLLDRNILPFSSIARTTLLQPPLPVLNPIPESETTQLKWVSLDFVLPSRLSNGNGPLQSCNERMMKLEITESLFFDPEQNQNRPKVPSKYWAVCVGLLKHPKSDADLSTIGAYDSVPGLARPESDGNADVPEGAADSEKWASVFAGIMTAMSHTGHSLVATIYCNNSPGQSQSQPIQTVIVQPLTPLSAVVRRTNLPLPSATESPQLTEGMQTQNDQNCLRKRVFAGLCDIAASHIDSVGAPCGSSQSSRFFEAHLSTIDCRNNEDCNPKPARDSATLAENLCRFARGANPRLISENLEALQNAPSLNDAAKLAIGLDEAIDEELGGELCNFSAGDLEHGDKLLSDLESRLAEINLPNGISPGTKLCTAASSHEPCTTPEILKDTIPVAECVLDVPPEKSTSSPPISKLDLPTSPLEAHKTPEDPKESIPSVVCVKEGDINMAAQEPDQALVPEQEAKNESMDWFSSEFNRIDECIGQVKNIESVVVVERCEAVLRAIGCLVDFGITRGIPMADDKTFNKRILKFKKIQKMTDSAEKSESDEAKKRSGSILQLCLRLYEQAILHIFKEMPRLNAIVGDDDKLERGIGKRLKRVSKILNMVQALAVSQDRFHNGTSTYHSLFDSFFRLVISRFTTKKDMRVIVQVGKSIASEFEKPIILEDESEAIARYQKMADESTPSSAVFDVLPPLPKRRRAREDSRRESRDRKRPRTKDLKQVLANATKSRSIPTGDSTRRDGIRSLVHEKGIQRPLLAKTKRGRNRDRRENEDDALTRWNRGRKLRYSSPSPSKALKPLNAGITAPIPIALNGIDFYSHSKKETSNTKNSKTNTTLASDNPILVSESEEGSEEDDD